MILIADSGSTKTEWCVINEGVVIKHFITNGMNPFHQSAKAIESEIQTAIIPQIKDCKIDKVFFYGAGCALPEKQEIVKTALHNYLSADIEIDSDLVAAAHALWGKNSGIVCIMGTGSNSAFWHGSEIVENVSPLGYILGDEGSGAVLGKLLVADILKNQLSTTLKEKFLQQFNLTPALILECVYRQPYPNRFLAELSVFCIENIDEPLIYKLVYNNFKSFFERNVMQYDCTYSVRCTGSVAYHYQKVLRDVASSLNITISSICQSPMDGLVKYHTENK